MDILSRLRQSNSSLLRLERALDVERDNLMNHPSFNADLSNNSTYFPYLSVADKYTGFANDYNKELAIFKELLQESINSQRINSHSVPTDNNEITSNYLPTQIVSTPVTDNVSNIDEPYINDDGNASTISREIATSNIKTPNQSGNNSVCNEQIAEYDEKALELPTIHPIQESVPEPVKQRVGETVSGYNRKIVKAKVINKMTYKYEGRGFDVWKKNGQRVIYRNTELYCSRIFGEDDAGKAKLKRFLIKRGGFKLNCIESVKIEEYEDGIKYGLITVRDKQENIENGIDKMNRDRKEDIIWENERINYYRNLRQNKKLYVKNFDILSGADHRKLTNLFLRFGDLETDIFMNRDRNGNPYAFVQFKDIEDAIECEKNQNMYRRQHESLWFNGRKLYIEYVNDKTRKNNNSRRR